MAHLAKKTGNKKKRGPDLGSALWLLVKSETAALGALQKADAGIKQQRLNSATLTTEKKIALCKESRQKEKKDIS